MMKRLMKGAIGTAITLFLFWLLYEPVSVYLSTKATKSLYSSYPHLVKNAKVESKSFALKKVSDDRVYSGNIPSSIFLDAPNQRVVIEAYSPESLFFISKKGVVTHVTKNLKAHTYQKQQLTVYPVKYYAFEHTYKAKGEPVNIVQYHKRRFEWPSACPYIGIPICNGWMWSGYAFFEVEHHGEFLKFHLDTQYALFDGYDGQVYKVSLPKEWDSQVAFINVNRSSNVVGRSTGWYMIVPKSK